MLPTCNCFQRWRWAACWKSVLPPSPSVRSVSFLFSCFPSLCPRFLVSFLGFPSVRLVSFLVSCFLPHVLVSVCPWWVSLSARSVYFLVQLSLLSCWRLLKISSPCFSVPFEALKLRAPVEKHPNSVLRKPGCLQLLSVQWHRWFQHQRGEKLKKKTKLIFCGRHALGCNGIGWMRREQLLHLLCRLQAYNHKENQNNLSPALS